MAKKTINQALKDLFLGLGGDPSALADNTSVSDYIADLESAIKAAATAELPTPAETNVGKVATVVSVGEGGYEWSAENAPTPTVDNMRFYAAMVNKNATQITVGMGTTLTFDELYNYCSVMGKNNPRACGLSMAEMTQDATGESAFKQVIWCIGTSQITDYGTGTTTKKIYFHGVIRKSDGSLYRRDAVLENELYGANTDTAIT